MTTTKKAASTTKNLSQKMRVNALQSMQNLLISEHQIACGYLTHLSTQPDIAELAPAEQRTLIQTGLEKYATIAQKMLSVLEKLTDHEQALAQIAAQESTANTQESAPTDLQWDMLIRHARRQLKQPLLPRVPLAKHTNHEDISNP